MGVRAMILEPAGELKLTGLADLRRPTKEEPTTVLSVLSNAGCVVTQYLDSTHRLCGLFSDTQSIRIPANPIAGRMIVAAGVVGIHKIRGPMLLAAYDEEHRLADLTEGEGHYLVTMHAQALAEEDNGYITDPQREVLALVAKVPGQTPAAYKPERYAWDWGPSLVRKSLHALRKRGLVANNSADTWIPTERGRKALKTAQATP